MGNRRLRFNGTFVLVGVAILGIALFVISVCTDGIASTLTETAGLTLFGSVLFSFFVSMSTLKRDCMEAAASILGKQDLSIFTEEEIAKLHSASIRDYIFRKKKFLNSEENSRYLFDVKSMEESIRDTFCSLSSNSVYMKESEQSIIITLYDDYGEVRSERREVFCMPIGTDFSYERTVSAPEGDPAKTYSIKQVLYNGENLDVKDLIKPKSDPAYGLRLYNNYEQPYVLTWKFDKNKTEHKVEMKSSYKIQPYRLFVSRHLHHYCAKTSFYVEIEDKRTKKYKEDIRIATEIFSPAITKSRLLEASMSKQISNMYTTSTARTCHFSTPDGLWMEPGGGYAIALNVIKGVTMHDNMEEGEGCVKGEE